MVSKSRIIIDTDGEFDDVLALALALRSSEVDLEAVTTVSGVRPLEYVTSDVLNTLEFMGRDDVPVAMGFRQHMSRDMTSTWDRINRIWLSAGRQSTAPIRKPRTKPVSVDAVEMLVSKVLESPGEITLVTLGALTNVASAILREPKFAENLKECYTMGGAVLVQGNMTPVAEFNIWGDPEAARIYFNSGVEITLVGLEVYYKARFNRSEWNTVRGSNIANKYFFDNFAPWIDYLDAKDPTQEGNLEIGDALTIGALVKPSMFEKKRCFVDVETKGELTLGQTVGYGLSPQTPIPPKKPNTLLCVNMDEEGFRKMFLERVAK